MLSHFGALTVAQETKFGELPLDFVALVLMRLPLDARLRAREVSRGWRALLNELRFWLVLDFSPGSGVVARLTRALLFAAGERARGHLHTLDLTGANHSLDPEHLVQFVAAHGQSLRTVTTPVQRPLNADQVTRLCCSASLCTLRCFVSCDVAEALPLLRCEVPFALLHFVHLLVHNFHHNQQTVLELVAALPSHSGKIKGLTVHEAPLRNIATADALMRRIAEVRVSNVAFMDCNFVPASLPGLTRLIQAGCLETVSIENSRTALFEAGPEFTTFCHALRNSTLQALELRSCGLWRDFAIAGELLVSLLGHPTLRELDLNYDRVGDTDDAKLAAAGEQLASLITHNTALEKLECYGNYLGQAGLAPIFEALPRSSTLKELTFWHETISREFARDVILPAVRANSSLQKLSFGHDMPLLELTEAHAIVAARTQRMPLPLPPPDLL